MTAGGALVIGLAVGGICYGATLLRERLRVDDALDVFAVHGVGGTFGAIATGVFATTAINRLRRGLIDGNPQQVVTQIVAVGATIAYAVVATFIIVKVVDVDPRDPRQGRTTRRSASTCRSTARPPTRSDPSATPAGPRAGDRELFEPRVCHQRRAWGSVLSLPNRNRRGP